MTEGKADWIVANSPHCQSSVNRLVSRFYKSFCEGDGVSIFRNIVERIEAPGIFRPSFHGQLNLSFV